MHPMGFDPMTSLFITSLWEEEVPFELELIGFPLTLVHLILHVPQPFIHLGLLQGCSRSNT